MASTQQIGFRETAALAEEARAAEGGDAFSLLVYRQHRFMFRVAYALLGSVPERREVPHAR